MPHARTDGYKTNIPHKGTTDATCTTNQHATMQFGDDFRQTWLAQHELSMQRHATLHRVNEQPGATALVLNLTPINLRSAMESISTEQADASEHPGVRVTFAIIRMLSAGFSAFQPEAADPGKRKAGARGGAATNTPKERYGQMQADGSVMLYSYALSNKKGVYSKGERGEQFIVVAPGMVISSRVFGNKLTAVFGKDGTPTESIGAFQLALVQLGTVSMSSKSSTSGNLLQIRTFTPLAQYTPSSLRMVPLGVLQSSTQAANARREAFLAGCMVAEGLKENADMSMIRSSLTSTFHALDVGYIESKNGAFAVSASGGIRFHVMEPITDISVKCIEARYDPRDFGTTDAQWLAKLWNVAVMFKSLRMLVSIDEYKNKNLDVAVGVPPPTHTRTRLPMPACSHG